MAGEKLPRIPEGLIYYTEKEGQKNSAFIFPGQGSFNLELQRELYNSYPKVRDLYQKADYVLRGWFNKPGSNLTSLMDLNNEHLKKTKYAQPAIYVFNEACRIAFMEKRKSEGKPNIEPRFYAGASLGLYNAFLATGAFTFEDGLRLVIERGKCMQRACDQNPSGLFALTGDKGSLKAVLPILEENRVSGLYEIYKEAENSDRQVVFGGSKEHIEIAVGALEEHFKGKLKATKLDVSGAFHTPLMKPTEKHFKKVVRMMIRKGKIKEKLTGTVLSNTTAKPIRGGSKAIGKELVNHLTMPVLWSQTMEFLDMKGISFTTEFGASDIYTKMMKDKGRVVKYGLVPAILVGGATLFFFTRRAKKEKKEK